MDMTQLLGSLQASLGETLPSLLGAVFILVAGWFVAMIVRAVVRRALGALALNEKIASSTGSELNVESGAASGAYYLILVFVLVAFFNALQLQQVSGSLQGLVDQIMAFAPKLIAGGVLLLVAWILASVVKAVATRALAATSVDDRLSSEAGMRPISESLGGVLYWLVFLVFLPGILGALEMQGLLGPVQGMVDEMLAMLPSIFGAGVIGIVGWFVARIVRDLVSNLLAAAGADQLGERAGLAGDLTLSKVLALVAYVFVLVPALIAALNALEIEAISQPATEMLSAFMAAIPNVFAAGVILAVAYFVSSFIAELAAGLLAGVGFDELPSRLGVADVVSDSQTPSALVGKLVVFFVMLFAVVEASGRLGFDQVADIVAVLIEFGGQVLLGLVIIGVGFWISNLAHASIGRLQGDDSNALAGLVRFGILGLVLAMGLRAMGLADDIVNLAFGLTLGAVAVAVALSFGLGGREAAGRQMEHWLSQLRRGE